MQVTEIKTDQNLMEIISHGTDSYPFEYYYDILEKYDIGKVMWHWHKEFEFVAVESGIIDCLIGDTRIRLHQGEGIFINSGVIHSFESAEHGVMPNILFAPEFIAASATDIYRLYIHPFLHSNVSHLPLSRKQEWQRDILEHLDTIFALCQNREAGSKLDIFAHCTAVWSSLVRNKDELSIMNTTGISSLIQARLRRMIQFIEDNYQARISLDDIVLSANISKSEALRCFKTMLGTTPFAYVNHCRLSRAQELLANSHMAIADIALEVGFENVSYFNKLYKKTYETTPRMFREHK